MEKQDAEFAVPDENERVPTPPNPGVEAFRNPDAPLPPLLPSTGAIQKRKEDRRRRKDPRSWANAMKAVSSASADDKLKYAQARYTDIYEELKQALYKVQLYSKEQLILQKERDQAKHDCGKTLLVRSKLESVCRELQKQNKAIKEENSTKIKEEEERRKETSEVLTEKLEEINTIMADNREKSEQFRNENLRMTKKLSQLYGDFQKREEDLSALQRQLDLHKELAKSKQDKLELELAGQRDIFALERAELIARLQTSESNCAQLSDLVKELQKHIAVYKGQYQGFETAITKSSDFFANFKSDMEETKKRLKAADAEGESWKRKYHGCMRAMLDLSETKKNQDLMILACERKNEQLQKLCRQMQHERTQCHTLLTAHKIPLPVVEHVPEPKKKEKKVVEVVVSKKEIELKRLKESLQEIQTKLDEVSHSGQAAAQESTAEKCPAKANGEKEEPVPKGQVAAEGKQEADTPSKEEDKAATPDLQS